MPHIYDFSPPLRGKGGPALRLRVPDPQLDGKLAARRLDNSPSAPYRASQDVENLLDVLTFGVCPKTAEGAILALTAGLDRAGLPALGLEFRSEPAHIHSTEKRMSPDVLISHSGDEAGEGCPDRVVSIAARDEFNLLVATLLRELGHNSFLSTVHSPLGDRHSAVAVVSGDEVFSYVISGPHPPLSQIVIFEDGEALKLLGVLRLHNEAKRLFSDVHSGAEFPEAAMRRYRMLLMEMSGYASLPHPARRIVEEELASLHVIVAGPGEEPS